MVPEEITLTWVKSQTLSVPGPPWSSCVLPPPHLLRMGDLTDTPLPHQPHSVTVPPASLCPGLQAQCLATPSYLSFSCSICHCFFLCLPGLLRCCPCPFCLTSTLPVSLTKAKSLPRTQKPSQSQIPPEWVRLEGALLCREPTYGLQTGLELGGNIHQDQRNLGCGLKQVASML